MRQYKNGIGAAHLGEERNWIRTGGGDVHQGTPSRARASESTGFDCGMLDKQASHFNIGIKQQRERSFRTASLTAGFNNRATDHLARSRMRRMSLYYYWISRSSRRCHVATANRKRKRKIACAKYRNRADGTQHGANVRFRERLAVRVCPIYSRIYPRSFFDQRSKKPQLITGATEFALQAIETQPGFESCAVDEFLSERLDGAGDLNEEPGFLLSGPAAVDSKGLFGHAGRSVHVSSIGRVEVRRNRLTCGGIHGPELGSISGCGLEADQRLPLELHDGPLQRCRAAAVLDPAVTLGRFASACRTTARVSSSSLPTS